MMVAKAGKMVGVPLRPHDLRRYAATFASRSGVPIEIVSKVILTTNLSGGSQGHYRQAPSPLSRRPFERLVRRFCRLKLKRQGHEDPAVFVYSWMTLERIFLM
jgi:hypothetical protein